MHYTILQYITLYRITLHLHYLVDRSITTTSFPEREEEVRILTAKVASLTEEISSGAPTERRIFELAQTQARREATHGLHNDSRSVAFLQLQQALAEKDLDLARALQSLAELTAEVTDLRRTHLREGINMDYLKNIVVQVPHYLFYLYLIHTTSFISTLPLLSVPHLHYLFYVSLIYTTSFISTLPLISVPHIHYLFSVD